MVNFWNDFQIVRFNAINLIVNKQNVKMENFVTISAFTPH